MRANVPTAARLPLLALLAGLLAAPGAAAADDERAELERQVADLEKQTDRLGREQRYQQATELAGKAHKLRQQLYPPDKFPAGHRDLVAGLHVLATLLQNQGRYGEALPHFRQALAMSERLYPADQFPNGHHDLANSLNNLGVLLQLREEHAEARSLLERALAMRRRLYPADKFPDGSALLAQSLINLAALFLAHGEFDQARPHFEQALTMYRRLFPDERRADGAPYLIPALNNLGFTLYKQGDYARARACYTECLDLCRQVYTRKASLPGHPYYIQALNNAASVFDALGEKTRARECLRDSLAMCERLFPDIGGRPRPPLYAQTLNNLGVLLDHRQDYAEVRRCHEQALENYRRLYPPKLYPKGHSQLVGSMMNLAVLLELRGEFRQAQDLLEESLRMCERLFAGTDFARGHPLWARNLNNLGNLFSSWGKPDAALPYYEQALAMNEQLYPAGAYPQGHPELIRTLGNLAAVAQLKREPARAWEHFHRAGILVEGLADVFAGASAEAEALNFVAALPLTRDGLVTVAAEVAGTEEKTYLRVWHSKAAVLRSLERRRHAALALLASASPEDQARQEEVRQAAESLQEARRELARLHLAIPRDRENHLRRLRELTDTKERLERELVELLPALRDRSALDRLGPADLAGRLPAGTAFVDLLRYFHIEASAPVPGRVGDRGTLRYVAFVVCRGRPVRRVDLGEARSIEATLDAWRSALRKQTPSPAAAALRRQVWEPVAAHLPADTRTVLLAPDAALTRLPWAALPGRTPGSVLLEEYAIGLVPHGPFLLRQLEAPPAPKPEAGLLLAVGGVDYDRGAVPPAQQTEDASGRRLAERGTTGQSWDELPGTAEEVKQVAALAGGREVCRRHGAEASTARLLADLPRARWAHLATHGFFADPAVRSALQLDPAVFEQGAARERVAPGARNPLVLSGLVLAGANRPPGEGSDVLRDDGGILTAEAIAGLSLEGLELVVLSACETGLGQVAGGEGAFSLQRAFHLAGARTVAASLWKLDDRATQALMTAFYENLWGKKLGKLEALRQAQLTVLRRYDPRTGKLRGPGERVAAADPKELDRVREGQPKEPRLPAFYWAGFVLTGDWR